MSPRTSASSPLLGDVTTLAFEAGQDCIGLLDLDGTLRALNAAGARLMGFERPESLVGRNWIDVFVPEERDEPRAALRAAARGGTTTLRSALPTVGGVTTWWDSTVMPLPGIAGAVDGILVVSREATRRAEKTRRRDETRLDLALDASGLGSWEMDLRSGERHVSTQTKRIFGLPDDLVADPMILARCIHPDDRNRVEAERRANLDEPSGTTANVSFRILRQDTGETRWVRVRGRSLRDQGDWTRQVGTVEDCTERRRLEEELRSTLRRHRALLAATSVVMWHADADQTRCEREGWAEFTGCPAGSSGHGWLEAVHGDDRAEVLDTLRRGLAAGEAHRAQYRLRHASGGWRWVSDDVVPLRDDAGRLDGWVGVISDIHDRRMGEDALRTSEQHLRLAIEASGLGTWDVNLVTGEFDASSECLAMLGIRPDVEWSNDQFLSLVDPRDREITEVAMASIVPVGDPRLIVTFRLVADGGEERWIEASKRTFFDAVGRPLRFAGTTQDVTGRKRAEREAWHAAHTDAVTGIANRKLFHRRLDAAVAEAGADGHGVGLVVIDLDRFKETNDTLGHDAGDAVLRTVAARLSGCTPPGATVARLGGDEFGVVVPVGNGGPDLAALASVILDRIGRPVAHAGRELDCSASIGWALYPHHDADAAALLKNADIALYAAKAAGRGRAAMFAPEMRDTLQHHVNVLRLVREALLRDAVLPFYQPKVSLRTGRIVGFEALLRWTDGDRIRPPAALQEAFADPELAVRLGARMLERVTADMRGWTDAGLPFGHVALNAAAPEFHDPGFAPRILDALGAARLRPDQFEIEVTEGVLLDDGTADVATALKLLHDAGVAVALDDFGTGYASLTHLKRFPVSWLKVDRSFVSDLERDGDAAAIVKAVVGLAGSIGIDVVAEGVETAAQRDFLVATGCGVGQGYLFAKPMSARALPDFVAGWRGATAVPHALPDPCRSVVAGHRRPIEPSLRVGR